MSENFRIIATDPSRPRARLILELPRRAGGWPAVVETPWGLVSPEGLIHFARVLENAAAACTGDWPSLPKNKEIGNEEEDDDEGKRTQAGQP